MHNQINLKVNYENIGIDKRIVDLLEEHLRAIEDSKEDTSFNF
jgi:hypothetical protein